MALLTDAAYALAATATLPVWLARMAATGKLRTDWSGRFGHAQHRPRSTRPRLLLHSVSVGEVNAIRHLVAELEQEPSPEIVISVTTDTGIARALALFGERHVVVRYPFDFGRCVRRFLDAVQPDAVALTELEVWPNFVAECRRRQIPVAVVNGRLSDRSIGRYRLLKPVLASTFRSLSLVTAQSEQYADRFRQMGVAPERVQRVGTMKWDTAEIADTVPGADELASAMGIDRTRPLVVAGSTAPGEEVLVRDALPDGAQLLCAPRKPEWFDAAAAALPGCTRRRGRNSDGAPKAGEARYFLLDTIGELRQAYALADLVIIGRTFALRKRIGGSDMMEPVALGKAVIAGPDTSNFREVMSQLLEARGIVQCTAEELSSVLQRLLGAPDERAQLAERGREVIRREQGASARTASLLRRLLPTVAGMKSGPPSSALDESVRETLHA